MSKSILPVALVMGVVSGLLVAGYFNVVNVPVMEWAISLEGAAAEAEAPGGVVEDEGGIMVSLGQQRIGLVAGWVIFGILFAAVFTGLYHLVRQATPGWNIWAWALIAGFLGFWALYLLPQIKYPLNPPGVGEEGTLLARQGFQLLIMLLSLLAVVAAGLVVKLINDSRTQGLQMFLRYSVVAVAYTAVALVLSYAIPGNPDPIPEWMPEALVILFRTFTHIGYILLWLLLSVGVAGYLQYQERGIKASEPAATRAAVG